MEACLAVNFKCDYVLSAGMVPSAMLERAANSRVASAASNHPKAVLTTLMLLVLLLAGDTAAATGFELSPSSSGEVYPGP